MLRIGQIEYYNESSYNYCYLYNLIKNKNCADFGQNRCIICRARKVSDFQIFAERMK